LKRDAGLHRKMCSGLLWRDMFGTSKGGHSILEGDFRMGGGEPSITEKGNCAGVLDGRINTEKNRSCPRWSLKKDVINGGHGGGCIKRKSERGRGEGISMHCKVKNFG